MAIYPGFFYNSGEGWAELHSSAQMQNYYFVTYNVGCVLCTYGINVSCPYKH